MWRELCPRSRPCLMSGPLLNRASARARGTTVVSGHFRSCVNSARDSSKQIAPQASFETRACTQTLNLQSFARNAETLRPPPAEGVSVTPMDTQAILTQSQAAGLRPVPAYGVSAATSLPDKAEMTDYSAVSPEESDLTRRSRPLSIAAGFASNAFGPSNRFSVSFPINPPSKEPSPTRQPVSPTREISPVPTELVGVSPNDGHFLTAIAAQERRVLELKEEVQKAEKDLKRLKSQWASHEAHKKRNEARNIAKLQPLITTSPAPNRQTDADGSSTSLQQENERRRALLAGPRASSRTVFSGSRHTRALSLLSPTGNSGAGAISQHDATGEDSLQKRSLEGSQLQHRPLLASRASTTPDLISEAAAGPEGKFDLGDPGIDREMLLKTGRKMALDFKDGLWTFFEDLRQATVGEEATQQLPPHLQRQSSSHALRVTRHGASRDSVRGSSGDSASSGASADTQQAPTRSPVSKRAPSGNFTQASAFSAEGPSNTAEILSSGRETAVPTNPAASHVKAPSVAASVESSDAWDAWDDSPKASRASSATSGGTSRASPPGGQQASPIADSDAQTPSKRDPIPWPALSKPGQATSRRSASLFMNEWEEGTDPLPEERETDQEEYQTFNDGA